MGFENYGKFNIFLWHLPYFKNPPNIAHQKKKKLCENPDGKMSSVGNGDSNRILKIFFWLKEVDQFRAKILFYNCIGAHYWFFCNFLELLLVGHLDDNSQTIYNLQLDNL